MMPEAAIEIAIDKTYGAILAAHRGTVDRSVEIDRMATAIIAAADAAVAWLDASTNEEQATASVRLVLAATELKAVGW